MKKILILLCVLVIFCFFTSITEAAEDFKPQHFFYDVPAGIYDLRGKAWNKTGMIILGTTLLTTFSIYQFAEPYQEGDKPWKSLGDDVDQAIDDYGGYFFYALPFMFFWGGLLESPQSEERRHTLAVTEELFESIILTTGSGLFFKEAIERDRPDGSGNHSLPSAHTALAFSLAGTLAWNYPWYVGASSITAASFIGFARID
jgi:membrane-associated phospholipid phosphatase